MEFINCGHRGAMGVAPENTMASFELGAEQGANELELDLRVSKDGVLVVIHDATVNRTTDGTGAVADMTYAELRALDAGEGERIPSFHDVLAGTDVGLQVEVKHPDVIAPLVTLLEGRPDEIGRVSPCSFDVDSVSILADRLPACTVGLTSSKGSPGLVELAVALGARRVLFAWPGTDSELIASAQQRGLHAGVWPVNTSEYLYDAVRLGIDGFTTDYPALLHESGFDIQAGQLVTAGSLAPHAPYRKQPRRQ